MFDLEKDGPGEGPKVDCLQLVRQTGKGRFPINSLPETPPSRVRTRAFRLEAADQEDQHPGSAQHASAAEAGQQTHETENDHQGPGAFPFTSFLP